jgi:hypothetical protein
MSEYQYYEFRAVDRTLSNQEMRELRSHSTRARITPTSFINHYEWGSFKGDVDAWMEKYFDAFLYLANWGTHVLKLRLPSRLLPAKTAKAYCRCDSAFIHEKAGVVIVSFIADEEEADDFDEDDMDLSSLISVRGDLARGDLRALYLGWLLCVQSGEYDDKDLEPPVPPGLGQLNASLESLAEFLYIDRDLLAVAAKSSPSLERASFDNVEVRERIAKLPPKEKNELLTRLIVERDETVRTEFLRKLHNEAPTGPITVARPRRTVGELRRAAEASADERRRMHAARRDQEKARCQIETALAREKYLESLAEHEFEIWDKVEALIATRQPLKYDEAINLLVDLCDLAARNKNGDFELSIEELRRTHARKPSFIQRLNDANLDSYYVPNVDSR